MDAVSPGDRHVIKTIAELGAEIVKMNFSYEVKNTSSPEYWQERVTEYEKYLGLTVKYYVNAMMLSIMMGTAESKALTLACNKLLTLSERQSKLLKRIKESPGMMDSKDKQQSRWSKGTREKFVSNNQKYMECEKELSLLFREFSDKHNLRNV